MATPQITCSIPAPHTFSLSPYGLKVSETKRFAFELELQQRKTSWSNVGKRILVVKPKVCTGSVPIPHFTAGVPCSIECCVSVCGVHICASHNASLDSLTEQIYVTGAKPLQQHTSFETMTAFEFDAQSIGKAR